jgi:hypothetical protein
MKTGLENLNTSALNASTASFGVGGDDSTTQQQNKKTDSAGSYEGPHGVKAAAPPLSRDQRHQIWEIIAAQAPAIVQAHGLQTGVLVESTDTGWMIYGPQKLYMSCARLDMLSRLIAPYGIAPDEATANKIYAQIRQVALATIDIGVDKAQVEEVLREATGVQRFNVLSSDAGDAYFGAVSRLRQRLADPEKRERTAKEPEFAVLSAAFGSGACGFSGPEAMFVKQKDKLGPEGMSLAEAQHLLEAKEREGYRSLRIVPAALQSEELTSHRGGVLVGTNFPCNEIQRYMWNGGDLDRLAVMVRDSKKEIVETWRTLT